MLLQTVAEIIRRGQGGHKGSEEVDAALHVAHVGSFDRAVHIAQGE